jgi:hypothetical protein
MILIVARYVFCEAETISLKLATITGTLHEELYACMIISR